jgi:hypothetical protein
MHRRGSEDENIAMVRLRTIALIAALAVAGVTSERVGPSGASAPRLSPAPGYWEVAADGGIFTYGGAAFHGSLGGQTLPSPVVGMAATPGGEGYRELEADGLVSAFGDATPESTGTGDLRAVGIGSPSNGVYLEAFGGGQVLTQAGSFATFTGPLAPLNAPIVGIAVATNGSAWLAASDGGVFGIDTAPFFGSMGGTRLNAPIVGMAATPDGGGYWLVGSDGGVFSFGDAAFYGSMGGRHLNAPVVGVAPTADGQGYWLVAGDGGVFSFGDAPFLGSLAGSHLNAPIVGIAALS